MFSTHDLAKYKYIMIGTIIMIGSGTITMIGAIISNCMKFCIFRIPCVSKFSMFRSSVRIPHISSPSAIKYHIIAGKDIQDSSKTTYFQAATP